MDAYSVGTLIRTLAGYFGPKTALAIVFLVALFFALRSSIAWFFQEVVRLLGEWVRAQTEEKRALLQQNQGYAVQIQTFLHNHLEHLKVEREEHRGDMAARDSLLGEMRESIVKANGALADVLESTRRHREEDATAHESMGKAVAKIEGRLDA